MEDRGLAEVLSRLDLPLGRVAGPESSLSKRPAWSPSLRPPAT